MEKRKCKLVLGNGFDLYCGMKTTFKNYYDSEVQSNLKMFDINFNIFITNLEEGQEDNIVKNYIDNLKQKINIWDYILFVKGFNCDNWFDFEKILEDFITKDLKKVEDYYSEILHVYNSSCYLGFKNTTDELFKIAVMYCWLIGINAGISSHHFYEELLKFEEKFGRYIYNEFNNNKTKMIPWADRLFNNLMEKYEISSIDTFNYTPIENEAFYYEKTKMIYHINGSCNNHPIFGYDYDEKDKFSELFGKTFRRIKTIDYCESYNSTFPLKEEFDDLVIFGHSLCKTDYSYYFPIFNYMHILESNYKNRIVIYYHNDDNCDRRTKLVFALKDMLKQYTIEMEGKANNRLIDSLATQGRLLFVKI